MIPLFGSSILKIKMNFQKYLGDKMKLIDMLYNLLVRQRDKKQSEIIRLRWQKENLQKQLDRLKEERQRAEGDR